MAIAETARLLASLVLEDKFSPTTTKALGQINALERATGRNALSGLQGGFARAGSAASKFGGALSHAKGAIGGLLSGPLGVLGLTGGLLGFGGAIESSLHKTSDFALILERLTGLTGESAQSMGELALVAEKYGVDTDRLAQIVGFAEKTIGKLTDTTTKNAASTEKVTAAENSVTKAHERLIVARKRLNELEAKGSASGSQLAAARFRVTDATNALSLAEQKLTGLQTISAIGTSKAADIQKKYGVSLLDARGHAVNFTTELERVADFYNSNASAADKAQLAAQLFGRGFAVMIPILQLGSKGIERAKQAIDDMGLSLGTDSQGAMQAYKQALRGLGEAVNILQIQIGLALAPAVTDLANNISLFLEHGGAKQIVGFFKDGAKFAQDMGQVVEHDVIPVFKGIVGAWNSVPKELRDLIITGFVANKTVKFLFGFSPISFVAGALEKGLSGLIGKHIVQPVFVTNPGALPGVGGAAGAAEGAAAAGGGIGLATAAAAVAVPVVLVAGGTASLLKIQEFADQNAQYAKAGLTQDEILALRYYNANKADQDRIFKLNFGRLPTAADFESANRKLGQDLPGKIADDLVSSSLMTGTEKNLGKLSDDLAGLPLLQRNANEAFGKMLVALRLARKPEDIRKAVAEAVAQVIGKQRGNVENTRATLAGLRAALARTHDPKLEAAIRSAIAKVEKKIVGREFAQRQIAGLDKILRSDATGNRKIDALHATEKALLTRGLPKAAHDIQARLDRAKEAISRSQMQGARTVKSAVDRKKLAVTVNNTTSTNVSVSGRAVFAQQRSFSRYYSTSSAGPGK
jgi:hypothetical protein